MKKPSNMLHIRPTLVKSKSPFKEMKIIATTTRPVLWPSPHRMPNDMAFHEFPTDKVASAERWSGPASTWNIPRMNPVLMSSLVIIPDKHWWPAPTALNRNRWIDGGSWLLKPFLESFSSARQLTWLRVTTLLTLSSVTVPYCIPYTTTALC